MRKKVQNGVNIINFFRVLVMGDGIKLFVYGVRPSCPRELLEREFSKSGQVSDIFNTGKGYAFVTMADEDGAQAAIKQLNGQMIDGQKIEVNIAHGAGQGGHRGGREGGHRGGREGGSGYHGRLYYQLLEAVREMENALP